MDHPIFALGRRYYTAWIIPDAKNNTVTTRAIATAKHRTGCASRPKGWESQPNVEHIQDIDDVLKVLDETTGAWRAVEDVYPAEHDYLWWGPLMPPVGPSAIEK